MAPDDSGAAPVLRVDCALADTALDDGGEGWAVLHDHVVVFATRLGVDGEPETTLVRWPGARVRVRLEREAGPAAGARLAEAVVEDERVGEVRRVRLASSRAEPVLANGRPVRVADLPTIGCPLPALSRRAMLGWLHRRVAPAADPAGFRALLHDDRLVRSAATGFLRGGMNGRRTQAAARTG